MTVKRNLRKSISYINNFSTHNTPAQTHRSTVPTKAFYFPQINFCPVQPRPPIQKDTELFPIEHFHHHEVLRRRDRDGGSAGAGCSCAAQCRHCKVGFSSSFLSPDTYRACDCGCICDCSSFMTYLWIYLLF